MPQTHVLNPQTNRMLKLTSKNCKRLIQLGIIQPPEIPVREPQENTKDSDGLKVSPSQLTPESNPESPKPPEVQEKELKSEVKAEMKKIIKENKNEFKELTQKETDQLLKRMLFEKLCVNKPKKEKKIAKPNPKKKKYKLRKIESSSESESESDSD